MLSDAVAFLTKYDSFLLMAHVAPDGDTLGSCLALQKLLQQLGKQAWGGWGPPPDSPPGCRI